MTRHALAAGLWLIVIGTVDPVSATSFSPYPEEFSRSPVGAAEFRLRGLQLQVYRHEGDELSDGRPLGGGTGEGRTAFHIRRAEIAVSGRLPAATRYLLVADLAAESPVIRDAFLEFGLGPPLQARIGQLRVPFGIETQLPPHRLPLINRMLMTWLVEQPDVAGGWIQEWDRGIAILAEPISGPLNATAVVALINGSGVNSGDTNDAKDFTGRIGLRLAGFQVGTSWYRGRAPDSGGVDRTRSRAGWDLEINPNPLKALLIRGELIHGHDATQASRGWYLLASYRFGQRWTPAVRVDRWDPDRAAVSEALTRTTLGIQVDLVEELTLTANYEFRSDESNPAVGNLALLQLQLSL